MALLLHEKSLHFSERTCPALALRVQKWSSTPLDVDIGGQNSPCHLTCLEMFETTSNSKEYRDVILVVG